MKKTATMLASSSILTIVSAASALAFVAPAMAQQAPAAQTATQADAGDTDAATEDQPGKDIIVTGTQIRGATPSGSQLLTTTAEQAREQGSTNGNEILSQLPQASNMFQSLPSFSQLQNNGSAVAVARIPSQAVTLRQLPGGQVNANLLPTLTLIDGHRAVPTGTDPTGGQQVDSSTVSSASLLRAEIMPDGASSIYGADALVGVINYITRDSFDGIEVQARGGIAGSYKQYDASLTAGKSWSTGSVFGSVAYSYHDMLLGKDQAYQVVVDANPMSPLYNKATGLNCTSPNIAVTTTVAGVSSRRLYPLTGVGGTAQPFTTNSGSSGNGSGGFNNTIGIAGGNRCDSAAYNSFVPKEKRYNAAFGLKQEITDTLTFGLKAMWMRRESVTSTTTNIQPTIARNNPDGTLNVNYRPVCTANGAGGTATCGVTPGFQTGDDTQTQTIFTNLTATSVGSSYPSYITLDSWQVTPTLTWDVSKDWQVRALASYGESKTTGIQGTLNTVTLQNRVNAGLINPYNLPASSPGAFEGIVNYSDKEGSFTLFNAKVIADGPLFTLPGGEVRVAAGGEYVSTKFSLLATGAVTSFTPNNFIFANVLDGSTNPISYTQTDKAAFAEANIPLVSSDMNVPLIDSLGLSASVRYDKYNDFGDTFNYMIGASWSPVSWIKTRGNYNTSFSAPTNITQLATVTGSQANNSNCNGPLGSQCSPLGNGVLSYFPGYYPPGIYPVAGTAGSLLPPGVQQSQAGATNQTAPTAIGLLMNQGTVPGVGPQKGKGWSLGFDIEPPFIPGLSFGASYYDLTINDQIQLLTGNAFTTRTDAVYCHNGVKGNDPNAPALCAIPFSAAELTTPGPLGFLAPVTAGGQALPSSLTSTGATTGSGSALNWQTVLANYCGPDKYPNCPANSFSVFTVSDGRANNIATLWAHGVDFRASYRTNVPWGSIDARVAGTVSLAVDVKATPTSPIVDTQKYGASTFRMTNSLGTTSGGFRGQITWQHSAGYAVDPVNLVIPGVPAGAGAGVGTPGTATVPGTGLYGQTRIGAFDTFDLFFRYDFGKLSETSSLFKGLELSLNVNNIFNTDPPRSGGSFSNGATLGRQFLLGLRKRF